jgi:hypothetical protein
MTSRHFLTTIFFKEKKTQLLTGQVLPFGNLFTADSLSLAQKLSGMPVLGNSIFI